MWSTLRGLKDKSSASLRSMARNGNGHLFQDIGLDRQDFVNLSEEQLRQRYYWYQ
jgi:hypothetical protein